MKKSADLNNGNMAPKSEENEKCNKNVSCSIVSAHTEELDFAEMVSVNESLDELNSVLDVMEQRTDDIIKKLKELLYSNREIRQSIAQENETIERQTINH